MSMPGFVAEASLYSSLTKRHVAMGVAPESMADEQVIPAIPPCHACDDILDLCVRGEARGAVCHACAIRHCDPQDWRRPPHPFPRSEPWMDPF